MRRLVLPLVAAALAAACGTGPAATTTSGSPGPGPDQHSVVMESFAYTPGELTVPVGTTVTWTNRHAARHDVAAVDGTFRSSLLQTGESYSFTFTETGEYPYSCTIHPAMQGRILVVDS